MKLQCRKCGKPIKAGFNLCYECHMKMRDRVAYEEYRDKTPEQREIELEVYYSHECSMCGKEGADERHDGRYYCGSCWQVWNS